jgi:hypothetical protein
VNSMDVHLIYSRNQVSCKKMNLKVKQLQQSLEEKAGELDKCRFDLHASEVTVEDLEKLLEEKVIYSQ